MMATGAYYRRERKPNVPKLASLGAEAEQANFANQILVELLGSAAMTQYTPWAYQVSDAMWQEVPREWTYSTAPINEQILQAVQSASGGHPVPFVAVLFEQPATLEAIERAYHGSRYAPDLSLGVYRLDTTKIVPRIYFLAYGQHRDTMPGDGAGGGSKSIDQVAAELKGRAVFVVQSPLPLDAPRPGVSFNEALATQLGLPGSQLHPGGATVPVGPAPAEDVLPGTDDFTDFSQDTHRAKAEDEKNTTLTLLATGAVVLGAAGLIWWLGRKKDPGRPLLPAKGETG